MQIEGKSDEKTDKKITRHFKKNYKSWIFFSISTIVVWLYLQLWKETETQINLQYIQY